jgi:poly-beta-1,6 N-acetyl-D-glucosamine synthase
VYRVIVLILLSYIILISFILSTESLILLAGLISAIPASVYLISNARGRSRRNGSKSNNDGNNGNNNGDNNNNHKKVKRKEGQERRKARGIGRTKSFPAILIYLAPMVIGVLTALYQGYNLLDAGTLYTILIAFGISLSFDYALVNLPLAVKHQKQEKRLAAAQSSFIVINNNNDDVARMKRRLFLPPVTIIVPAYNEEAGIGRTLDALVEVDYPNKEVLVVDDGSKDRTYAIASSYVKKAPPGRFSVIRKENGGKASAINTALRFAKGEIIVIIDADAIVARDTLKELVKQFSDDEDGDIAAIAGNPKVLNRKKFWSKLQVLEYAIGISLFKRAYALFGVVMVVPGGLGAFRKKYLIESGLYDSDTLTEDFDITIKVLKTGKKVVMASRALSFSEVPETLRDLYKQRMRWQGGNLQTLIKHKDILTNSRYGMLYKYGYPLILLTMLTLPFLGMVVAAFIFVGLLYDMWFILLSSFIIFGSLQFVLGAIAIILDDEDWKYLLYAPLMVIGYKQILDFFTVKSTFDVLFRRNLKWNPSTRYGMVASNVART